MFSIKNYIVTGMIVIATVVGYGLYTHMSPKSILIFALIALFAEIGIDIFSKAMKKQYKDKDEDNESLM